MSSEAVVQTLLRPPQVVARQEAGYNGSENTAAAYLKNRKSLKVAGITRGWKVPMLIS